ASNMAALTETTIAASEAGTVLIPIEVRAVEDFDPAFAAVLREQPDAVLVSNDLFHQLHIGRIIEFLAKNRLPGMFQSKESVVAGGFIAYGRTFLTCFGALPATCRESCKVRGRRTCRWSCRRSSISRSI